MKEQAISEGLFYHTKTNTKSPKVLSGQSLLRPQGTPSKYSHLNKSPAGNPNQVSPNNSSSNLNGYIPTIVQQQTSIPSTPLNSSHQQSTMRIDNSLVQLLVPQVPLVQPNVTESDEAVAEDVEINPPLGDSSAYGNEISRALETAALVSQEIKSPSPVKVVPGQSPKVQDTEDAQCQYCDRFFPNLDSVQNHILKKHCEHCKLCNMMIKGNFEDHLHNSHFKQQLESGAIPQQKRGSSEFGCSGKKIYFYLSVF